MEDRINEPGNEEKNKILLRKDEGITLEFIECKIIIPLKEDLVNQLSEDKSSHKTVEKIIAAIKENPKITIKELEQKTGLTRRGVEWNIEKLKQQGKLKRIGPDKGGYWEVGYEKEIKQMQTFLNRNGIYDFRGRKMNKSKIRTKNL